MSYRRASTTPFRHSAIMVLSRSISGSTSFRDRQADAAIFSLSSLELEGDEFRGLNAAADGDYDVLFALVHVGHGSTARDFAESVFPEFCAIGLIESANNAIGTGIPHVPWIRIGLNHEQESLRQHAAAVRQNTIGGRAEWAEIEVLNRRVISRSIAVGHLPDEFSLVEIDGRDAPVRRLHKR